MKIVLTASLLLFSISAISQQPPALVAVPVSQFVELAGKIDKELSGIDLCTDGPVRQKEARQLAGLKKDISSPADFSQKTYDALNQRFQQITGQILGIAALPQPELPPSPADTASTSIGMKNFALGLGGGDAFNREVKVTAGAQYPLGTVPNRRLRSWLPSQHNLFGTVCSQYIFNLAAAYDDKWKATSSPSNLTQTYFGEVVDLNRLLGGINTVIYGAAYHDNSQGIRYDIEPAMGVFLHWGKGVKSTTAEASKETVADGGPQKSESKYTTVLGLAAEGDVALEYFASGVSTHYGLRTYFLWQFKPSHQADKDKIFAATEAQICDQLGTKLKQGDVSDESRSKFQACQDLNQYLKSQSKTSRHTFAFNLRGFLPTVDTLAYGHASAKFEYDYKFSPKWSLSVSALDTYYSTVPTAPSYTKLTFNHNSFIPALSVAYTPQ